MKDKAKAAALAGVFLLLGACQTTDQGQVEASDFEAVIMALAERDLRIGEPANNIPNFRLNGWTYIDDRNLIVHSSPTRQYLITTTFRCQDMRYALSLGIEKRGLLLSRGDAVVVASMNSTVDRCYIQEIYTLEEMEAENEAEM